METCDWLLGGHRWTRSELFGHVILGEDEVRAPLLSSLVRMPERHKLSQPVLDDCQFGLTGHHVLFR